MYCVKDTSNGRYYAGASGHVKSREKATKYTELEANEVAFELNKSCNDNGRYIVEAM